MPTSTTQNDRDAALYLAETFKRSDWLIPAYLSIGFLVKFALALNSPGANVPDVLRNTLSLVYSEEYIASHYLGKYSTTNYVKDFKDAIGEAFEIYFLNYKRSSISVLLPVIEGIVRKISTSHKRGIGHGTKRIVAEFDFLVKREANSPNRFDERLVMLEVLRDFIRDRLFADTRTYTGLDEFNRHGILHGVFGNYGDDMNFFRVITLLDLLCFTVGLSEGGVSLFAAGSTPESLKLARLYKGLRLAASTRPS